jgi:hypothetical protein
MDGTWEKLLFSFFSQELKTTYRPREREKLITSIPFQAPYWVLLVGLKVFLFHKEMKQ